MLQIYSYTILNNLIEGRHPVYAKKKKHLLPLNSELQKGSEVSHTSLLKS